ncbi:MAG: beta strand repeat-containing protein, partial [Burkholderiales bacterium]
AAAAAASSGPVNLVSLSLTGTVTLGPMLAANQLRVVAYDRDGKILGSDETVEGTTGAFEIKITNGYSGVVIFKVLDGNPNEADYMDEATQRGLSLGKTGALPDLRAIVVTEGIVPKTVHINPLTELAAVKSGLAEGSVVTTRSSAELLTISRALAKTLALSTTGQLLSDIAVIPTVNLDGSPNASANDAGKLLDTISQLERLNNFTSPTAAIATVAGQLKEVDLARGESGFKDPTVTNVAQFQTAVLQTPPTIAGVTFSADTGVSGTDLITSNGTQNITVKFSKALESTRTLSWKTTDSGVWSAPVAGNGTDTLVLTGASLSSGSRTLQFRYTSTATSLSEAAQVNTGVNLVYTLDTTAPTTPVVTDLIFSVDSGTSGTDLITNSAAQTVSGTITSAVFATERIFGSVDGGVTWSEITNRSTNNVTGETTFNWNVAALVNQTATGTKSLVFQVRDAAGNVSSNSNATPYVLDTAVPDNSIDLSTITISADTGTDGDFRTATKVQTITAQLGKGLNTSPANGETLWGSVDNGSTWTDLNGSIANRTTGGRNLVWTNVSLIEGDNTIVFKITDVAGNTLAALGNRTYFLETLPPPPTLTLAADTGVNTNDGITRNGRFNVTDVLSGHTWQYSLDGGTNWTTGSGTFFIAPAGSYVLGAIQLRQTSEGGLVSAVDKTLRAITIDTSAAAPTLALAADTGDDPNDFITNNGTINVTGLEAGATWRYRLGGGDWQTGGAVVAGRSSFVLPSSGLLGTFYAASEIQVQQTDLAGNTSAITSYGNAVRVRTTPPDMSFASGGGLSLSADSGTTTTGFYRAGTSPQNNDWLTNTTSQIIRATLSQRLATGDRLLGSIDNGVNFR